MCTLGFGAHQDAPAFTSFGPEYHVNMMLAIDPATVANGCLEVAAGQHTTGLLPMNEDLTIKTDIVEQLVCTININYLSLSLSLSALCICLTMDYIYGCYSFTYCTHSLFHQMSYISPNYISKLNLMFIW